MDTDLSTSKPKEKRRRREEKNMRERVQNHSARNKFLIKEGQCQRNKTHTRDGMSKNQISPNKVGSQNLDTPRIGLKWESELLRKEGVRNGTVKEEPLSMDRTRQRISRTDQKLTIVAYNRTGYMSVESAWMLDLVRGIFWPVGLERSLTTNEGTWASAGDAGNLGDAVITETLMGEEYTWVNNNEIGEVLRNTAKVYAVEAKHSPMYIGTTENEGCRRMSREVNGAQDTCGVIKRSDLLVVPKGETRMIKPLRIHDQTTSPPPIMVEKNLSMIGVNVIINANKGVKLVTGTRSQGQKALLLRERLLENALIKHLSEGDSEAASVQRLVEKRGCSGPEVGKMLHRRGA